MTVMFVLVVELCERVRCSLCSKNIDDSNGDEDPLFRKVSSAQSNYDTQFLNLFNPIKYFSYK